MYIRERSKPTDPKVNYLRSIFTVLFKNTLPEQTKLTKRLHIEHMTLHPFFNEFPMKCYQILSQERCYQLSKKTPTVRDRKIIVQEAKNEAKTT